MTAQPYITPPHLDILAKSGISKQDAIDWGITSVTDDEGLVGTDLQGPHTEGKTGLLFPLRRLDGSVTYQLRLDQPQDDRKYIQASTGSIINVPHRMVDRLDTAKHLVIVEGTKQTICATIYAPDDVIVVGIQGCRNWSKDGVMVPDMSSIMRGRDRLTIALDADRLTNANVYEAAVKLKANATAFGVPVTRYTSLPSGGKTGLDDFLGGLSEDMRAETFANLLEHAEKSPGRKPAAKKRTAVVEADADVEVDLVNARITKTTKTPDGGVKTEPVLQAAARIIASEARVDEESGETSSQVLTLEVRIPEGDGKHSVHQVKTASKDLANVGEWLDRLPRGIGVSIPRKSKPDDDVANAIRTVFTDFKSITVVPRTGWTFDHETDEWFWCDGYGAIGTTSKIDRLRGEPASRDFQAINLPDLSSVDSQVVTRSARDFIMARELLEPGKEFMWDVAVASWGLAFLGITPNAALCYFGPPSSGKSTIAQALASSMSESWAPMGNAMSTFNARPAGMDLLPNGLSHCLLHVDDLRPEADRRAMEQAWKAFDALLRRAHGSGGAVRGEVNRAQDSLGVRKVDSSAPMVVITGEQIPSGNGFADSGLDRALILQVQPKTLFSEDNLPKFQNRAQSGSHRIATASYIRWLAGLINHEESNEGIESKDRFAAWRAKCETARVSINQESSGRKGDEITGVDVEPLFPPDMKVSSRASMLAASLMLGRQMVLEWGVTVGALSLEEKAYLYQKFRDELVDAIKNHTSEVMGGNASESDSILAELRNGVSSKRVTIEPLGDSHAPLIGERKSNIDGQDVLAINHHAAAHALNLTGGPRGVIRALSDIALRDSNGKSTRTIQIGEARVQAIIIKWSDWTDGKDEAKRDAAF